MSEKEKFHITPNNSEKSISWHKLIGEFRRSIVLFLHKITQKLGGYHLRRHFPWLGHFHDRTLSLSSKGGEDARSHHLP